MKHFIGRALTLVWAFTAGVFYQYHFYGQVRMYEHVEIEGDPYNRGQQSIRITFPASIRPEYVWLPSGDMYPDSSKPRWVAISPDGKPQTRLDDITLFVANEKCPTPGCRLGGTN